MKSHRAMFSGESHRYKHMYVAYHKIVIVSRGKFCFVKLVYSFLKNSSTSASNILRESLSCCTKPVILGFFLSCCYSLFVQIFPCIYAVKNSYWGSFLLLLSEVNNFLQYKNQVGHCFIPLHQTKPLRPTSINLQ